MEWANLIVFIGLGMIFPTIFFGLIGLGFNVVLNLPEFVDIQEKLRGRRWLAFVLPFAPVALVALVDRFIPVESLSDAGYSVVTIGLLVSMVLAAVFAGYWLALPREVGKRSQWFIGTGLGMAFTLCEFFVVMIILGIQRGR